MASSALGLLTHVLRVLQLSVWRVGFQSESSEMVRSGDLQTRILRFFLSKLEIQGRTRGTTIEYCSYQVYGLEAERLDKT